MPIAVLFSVLTVLGIVQAQESPPPSATPARNITIRFVPPPLEGTISLGIYDAAGKLVRILHREDAISEFTAGHDALETVWDGNDDAGNAVPTGRYSARGYLVAPLKIEGVDYFFNDWVTDETSPHLAHISRIRATDHALNLSATLADGKEMIAAYDLANGKIAAQQTASSSSSSELRGEMIKTGASIEPVGFAMGKAETVWVISHVASGAPELEIKQFSRRASPGASPFAALRKLTIPPNEPQPIGIAASTTEDRIFLLEQTPQLERVRSLTLVETKPDSTDQEQSISDWKTDFEKKIIAHKNFALENGKPVASTIAASSAPETITQKLRPNPLQRDKTGEVELAIGIDADGSYLQTADGLPLRTISDARNLSRALLSVHDKKAVDVFQDDGGVVEQFRISDLDQMMAFDCGEFELK